MLLVTGCGRSGTHFTARVLQELGLDVPHEDVGKDGAASWKHIVSGTFVYVGKNRTRQIRSEGFTRILHQVRHPLKVIASMQTFSRSTWGFKAQFIPLDPTAPVIVRGMQAWMGWNQLIEGRAHWRFQIEKLGDEFDEFCRQAGLAVRPIPRLPDSAKDSRTQKYRRLAWKDLVRADSGLAEQVRQLALNYGYEDIASCPPPATAPERKPGFWQRWFVKRGIDWPLPRTGDESA